eukprot:ANDGO_05393.mRNA.1 hypothetical protein
MSSVWDQVLADAQATNSQPNHTLLVVGTEGCGKSHLLHRLFPPANRSAYSGVGGSHRASLFMDYAFVDLSNPHANMDSARVHVWQASDPQQMDMLDLCLSRAELNHPNASSTNTVGAASSSSSSSSGISSSSSAASLSNVGSNAGVNGTIGGSRAPSPIPFQKGARSSAVSADSVPGSPTEPVLSPSMSLSSSSLLGAALGRIPVTVFFVLDLSQPWFLESQFNAWIPKLFDPKNHYEVANLVMVGAKSEMMDEAQREWSARRKRRELSDLHFRNYIQFWFRKQALSITGTKIWIVFVSSSTGRNIDVLSRLCHHLFLGVAVDDKRQVDDMDALFMPPGADSQTSVSRIVIDNEFATPFQQVIPAPEKTEAARADNDPSFVEWSGFLRKHWNFGAAQLSKSDAMSSAVLGGSGGVPVSSGSQSENAVEAGASSFFKNMLNRYQSSSNLNAEPVKR